MAFSSIMLPRTEVQKLSGFSLGKIRIKKERKSRKEHKKKRTRPFAHPSKDRGRSSTHVASDILKAPSLEEAGIDSRSAQTTTNKTKNNCQDVPDPQPFHSLRCCYGIRS
jgi:hypothetical protein